MDGKRLALGAVVIALVVGLTGALSNSAGQSPGTAPGVSYGGDRSFGSVWLRLHPSRNVIAAIEIPWEIAPNRCQNDTTGYFGTLFAGLVYQEAIVVNAEGRFSKTVVDRYRGKRGIRYEDRQTVTGRVTDERASGTLRAVGITKRPDGPVGRCTSRPQPWSAVN
jgi:hypothetical protein